MAILPRWKRIKQRDWKDPFSWFRWYHELYGPDPFFYYNGNNDPREFGGTFARADASTCATYIDGAGVVRTVAANIPRFGHYDPSNVSLGPTLLLEGSRQNIVVQSEALATSWTTDCTMTNAYASYAGLSFTRASSMSGSSTYQAVTFTGDGVKAISIFVRQDAAIAGTTSISLRDVTGAAWRLECQITIAAGGAVTASCATGTLLGVQALASGVYRVLCATTSVTAANTNRFYAINGGTCTSVLLAGAMAENASFPSSYIPTTTAAVTRAVDSLSFPFLPVPQAMTVYADCVDLNASTGSYFSLGTSTHPELLLYNAGGPSREFYHHNGTSAVSKQRGAPVFGQRTEFRCLLNNDGSVALGVSDNSAAEVVSTTSAALTLAAAWATQVLYVNSEGGSFTGFLALRSLKIAAGVNSLNRMRWLV